MDEKFCVEWLARAKSDLLSIVSYIAEQGLAPEAAAKLEVDIIEAVENLSYSPYRSVIDERREIRKFAVKKRYVILFKIHEGNKTLKIRRIFDGRRNWQMLSW